MTEQHNGFHHGAHEGIGMVLVCLKRLLLSGFRGSLLMLW
jgi:hypothetical protein